MKLIDRTAIIVTIESVPDDGIQMTQFALIQKDIGLIDQKICKDILLSIHECELSKSLNKTSSRLVWHRLSFTGRTI